MNEPIKKLMNLMQKRESILVRFVEPTRAAANAMKDAQMHRTADPLLAALLFEIDAVDQEISSAIKENPRETMLGVLALMKGGGAL